MRISVVFSDRVGIAQEVLGVLARRSLNVTAVEVDPPWVYIEAPELDQAGLVALRQELAQVPGVQSVDAVAMLPGAQRRLYLNALMAAQADPVLAIDARGEIVVANGAALAASGMSEDVLLGSSIKLLVQDEGLLEALIEGGYHLSARGIEIPGEPYLLGTLP